MIGGVLNQSTPEPSRSVEVTCSTSQAKCWAANASAGSFSVCVCVCVDYISCDAYRELCQLTVAGSILYCDTTVWSLPNHCVHLVNVSSSSLPVIDTVREGCQCGRWRHNTRSCCCRSCTSLIQGLRWLGCCLDVMPNMFQLVRAMSLIRSYIHQCPDSHTCIECMCYAV